MEHKEYQSISLGGDPKDDRSSTEVDHDELQMGYQARQRETGPWQRRKRHLKTFQFWRGLFDTGLLLTILTLLALLLRKEGNAPAKQLQVGSEYTGGKSHLSTKVIKWNASPAFVPNNTIDFFSPATLATWNTLIPSNAGRPTSADTEESFSTTSMTHQLHCLFMMGRIYAGITQGMTDRLPTDYHAHFLHCIDYIRQGVMCAGDLAVEPHTEQDPDDLGPLDGGWQGRHVCKDYGEVLGALEGEIQEGRRVVLPIDD